MEITEEYPIVLHTSYTGHWEPVDTEDLEYLGICGELVTITDNYKMMASQYGLPHTQEGFAEVALRVFEREGVVERRSCGPNRAARLERFDYFAQDTGYTAFRISKSSSPHTHSLNERYTQL